jgi:hypothetical protein
MGNATGWDAIDKSKVDISPHDAYAQALQRRQADVRQAVARRATGCVYFLQSEHVPDSCKVGMTRRDPQERAREISAATGALPFRVFAVLMVTDHQRCETIAHACLRDFRIEGKELFTVAAARALSIVRDALRSYVLEESQMAGENR